MTTEWMSGLGAATASGQGWLLWSQRRELLGELEAATQSFAVMEDDAVLCAGCVQEAVREGRGAQSLVRAWIDAGPGVGCGWCGVAVQLDRWEG